jgi:hypothetical protein
VELAVADIERADARRAGLEEAVGEAAGRGSDVQAVLSLDIDGEGRERIGELLAAARDEAGAGLDLDLRRLVDLCACERVSASPRSTMRTSSRFLVTWAA